MIRRLLAGQKHRERIAVIGGDNEFRYIDLLEKAWALRSYLPKEKAESIAILLPDGGNYIAAFWGVVWAGMIAFPLNVLMTGHEILPLLIQASAHTVITTAAYRSVFEEISGFQVPPLNILWMDELRPTGLKNDYAPPDADPDQPMLLLSTSGTTGKSKIVQLSERNIETAVLGYLDKLRFPEASEADIRYILAVPFSSVYSVMILSACLMRSFPIIVLDSSFTLGGLYRAAEKHRATHYEGSASTILLMERMAGRPIPYDIHTLTYFGFGGSKVSGNIIEKLFKAYPGTAFYQGYGMTEASPLITKHPQETLEKSDSVGTAIRGIELAVEAGNEIKHIPYTEGEIVVRGPNVMLGYLGNAAETGRVLKNGYLHTGDIGYLDDEGYLYICGRKKSIIIVRGFTVYPEEVETCILGSRLARDCLVYGQANEDGSEMVCADIVPMNSGVSKEAIQIYCREHLAEYKWPQRISFCSLLRKNASGKTERHSEATI